jgi:serine phosphatase RsbU (regulator of sigma subunit)
VLDEPLGAAIDGLAPEALVQAILATLPDVSVFVFGPDLRYRMVEGAGAQYGWSRDEMIGRRPSELRHDDPVGMATLEDAMRGALAGERRVHEIGGLRHDSYWENTVSPLTTTAGRVVGGMVVARNLGPWKRAEADRSRSEQEAARWNAAAQNERRLRERLEFLGVIDRLLAGCRDRIQVMKVVTAAAVPRLGDWCSIHVLMSPRDSAPTVEVGHVDPDMIRTAMDVLVQFPYDAEGTVGIPQVIRTGEPVLFTGIHREMLEQAAAEGQPTPEDEIGTIQRLDLTSSLIVPLSAGGRTFGVLTFSVSGGERSLDQDDLTLAQALAGRVAVALENARLGELERQIADTLQRSLLPAALPVIPGAQVAVRYWAAGEGTKVGGDFYDVFDTGHGAFAVVVGDVCGSGPAAAAVTATARHTVRALARHGDDHGTVLRHLNDAVLTSWPDIFCTVAYATLASDPDGLELTTVSGGHPLPILVRSGGTVSKLGRPGTLIGAFEFSELPHMETFTTRLVAGDTVVFYTDGAYDLPPPGYLSDDEVLDLVARAAVGAPDAETVADAIARQLESRAPFEDRDDDVAVVVVRVG